MEQERKNRIQEQTHREQELQQREVFWDCDETIEERVHQIMRDSIGKVKVTSARLKEQIQCVINNMRLVGLEPNKI